MCGNIIGYDPSEDFYEKEGFKIHNFKDICEEVKEAIETTKLSDFLKENNCYEEFINNFDKEFSYSQWKININSAIAISFAWDESKEGFGYWYFISNKWKDITNKENDMIKFFEENYLEYTEYKCGKGEDAFPDIWKDIKPTEPLDYLVQVKGKGTAKVKHTYESAIKEAKRLCKKEAPTEVYVLEIKKTFKSEVLVKEI